jgi:hypothetical protein
MYLSRPPTVDAAVREKWHEACQPWVMDSADNYEFGAYGRAATACVPALAAAAAAAGRPLRVFDAGTVLSLSPPPPPAINPHKNRITTNTVSTD